MITEEQYNKAKMLIKQYESEQLDLLHVMRSESATTVIINRLFDLQRFDIDAQWNGEFTELEERIEADGKFVRWEDVREVMSEILVSNSL